MSTWANIGCRLLERLTARFRDKFQEFRSTPPWALGKFLWLWISFVGDSGRRLSPWFFLFDNISLQTVFKFRRFSSFPGLVDVWPFFVENSSASPYRTCFPSKIANKSRVLHELDQCIISLVWDKIATVTLLKAWGFIHCRYRIRSPTSKYVICSSILKLHHSYIVIGNNILHLGEISSDGRAQACYM